MGVPFCAVVIEQNLHPLVQVSPRIMNVAVPDHNVFAPGSQPDSMGSGLRDRTIHETRVKQAIGQDERRPIDLPRSRHP